MTRFYEPSLLKLFPTTQAQTHTQLDGGAKYQIPHRMGCMSVLSSFVNGELCLWKWKLRITIAIYGMLNYALDWHRPFSEIKMRFSSFSNQFYD